MPAIALAEALPDFGSGREAAAHPSPDFAPAEPHADGGAVAQVAAAEEREAAETALRAELEQRHEEALAAERERHAAEMEALQEKLGERTGTLVADQIAGLESRVVELTASLAARILGTALTEDLRRRAVEALSRTIGEALADRDTLRIAVRGAPHMFEALAEALGPKAEHLDFTEAGDFDLTVSIDGKLYETRLSEWSAALSEVLA